MECITYKGSRFTDNHTLDDTLNRVVICNELKLKMMENGESNDISYIPFRDFFEDFKTKGGSDYRYFIMNYNAIKNRFDCEAEVTENYKRIKKNKKLLPVNYQKICKINMNGSSNSFKSFQTYGEELMVKKTKGDIALCYMKERGEFIWINLNQSQYFFKLMKKRGQVVDEKQSKEFTLFGKTYYNLSISADFNKDIVDLGATELFSEQYNHHITGINYLFTCKDNRDTLIQYFNK